MRSPACEAKSRGPARLRRPASGPATALAARAHAAPSHARTHAFTRGTSTPRQSRATASCCRGHLPNPPWPLCGSGGQSWRGLGNHSSATVGQPRRRPPRSWRRTAARRLRFRLRLGSLQASCLTPAMGQRVGKAQFDGAAEPFVSLAAGDLEQLWRSFNEVAEGFGLRPGELRRICASANRPFSGADVDALFRALDTDAVSRSPCDCLAAAAAHVPPSPPEAPRPRCELGACGNARVAFWLSDSADRDRQARHRAQARFPCRCSWRAERRAAPPRRPVPRPQLSRCETCTGVRVRHGGGRVVTASNAAQANERRRARGQPHNPPRPLT